MLKFGVKLTSSDIIAARVGHDVVVEILGDCNAAAHFWTSAEPQILKTTTGINAITVEI